MQLYFICPVEILRQDPEYNKGTLLPQHYYVCAVDEIMHFTT